MTPQLVAVGVCLIGAGIALGYTLFYLVYHHRSTRIPLNRSHE